MGRQTREYEVNASEILRLNYHVTLSHGLVSTYNFPTADLPTGTTEIIDRLGEVYRLQEWTFRAEVALCYILYNALLNRYRYFAPFNSLVNQIISTPADLKRVSNKIPRLDLAEEIWRPRPDTKSCLRIVTNIIDRVFKTSYTLGGLGENITTLPKWLKDCWCIVSMTSYHSGRMYLDHLCFFRCLAFHYTSRMKLGWLAILLIEQPVNMILYGYTDPGCLKYLV